MPNFLIETDRKLKSIGMNADDIAFIGSANGMYGCTWNQFVELSDFEYDNGFGGQEIPSDLIIVFKDNTWLSRYEYDGSESWEYNKPISVPKDYILITNLEEKEHHHSWQTVAGRQATS